MTHHYSIPDLVFGPLVILAGVLAFGIAWHYSNNVHAMLTTDQSDAGTVPGQGLVEVAGHIHEVPDPLTAPLSGADCVSYALDIEEYRREDDLTKEWVYVETIEQASPFVLADNTGAVTVDPSDPDNFRCDISHPERNSQEIDSEESPKLAIDIDDPSDEEYPRRYREQYLPTAEDVYILGMAEEYGDRIVNSGGDPFIVSTGNERRTISRHVGYSLLASGFGIALSGWGIYLLLGKFGLI